MSELALSEFEKEKKDLRARLHVSSASEVAPPIYEPSNVHRLALGG